MPVSTIVFQTKYSIDLEANTITNEYEYKLCEQQITIEQND